MVFSLLLANSKDPDQTLHHALSDLGLHCLCMSHKKDARLIWVKKNWCKGHFKDREST